MIRLLVNLLVFMINIVYRDRPYPRFYVLETVARIPYFAYMSVLHLYETLGWWRKADWLKIHFHFFPIVRWAMPTLLFSKWI